MKKILLTLALLFLANLSKAQVVVLHFNADWNKSHAVEWVEDL